MKPNKEAILRASTLDEEVHDLEDLGLVVLKGVIPRALLHELQTEVYRIMATEPSAKKATAGKSGPLGTASHQVRNLFSRQSVFREAALFEPVTAFVQRLLGPKYLLFSSAVNSVGPGAPFQRLHTDDMLVNLPRPLGAPVIVNAIWALSDFTEANGATRLAPYSHRFAKSPEDSSVDFVAEMTAGSVLLYQGSVWHQAGANITPSDRRLGLIFAYCARFIRPYENQLKLIPIDEIRRMSPRARQLAGFEYGVDGL